MAMGIERKEEKQKHCEGKNSWVRILSENNNILF
jgi:hypothetical protein